MEQPVSPELQERFTKPSCWREGFMRNARGNDLRWGGSTAENATAHIVYVEGLSEYAEKTFELAREFNANACNFWVLDRQGQGLSGRYLKDKFKQHSDGFDHDACDVVQMVRDIVPHDGKPVILLGHSTGGLVALLALQQAQEKFAGAFLTAPLFGLERPIAKNQERLVGAFKKIVPNFILEKYLLGSGAWMTRNDERSTTKEDFFSSDPDRMKIHSWWQERNENLRVGGPTYGWGLSACQGIGKVQDKKFLSGIEKPVHIFTAGKEDLIHNKPVFEVFKGLKNARYTHFAAGKHELLMETDNIRKPIIDSVLEFVRRQPS